MRKGRRVAGLSAAATLWLAAAIGMGIRGGYHLLVPVATCTILLALWIFPRLEHWTDNIAETRAHKVIIPPDSEKMSALNRKFEARALKLFTRHMVKTKDTPICTRTVIGPPKNHHAFVQDILADRDVTEFDY